MQKGLAMLSWKCGSETEELILRYFSEFLCENSALLKTSSDSTTGCGIGTPYKNLNNQDSDKQPNAKLAK